MTTRRASAAWSWRRCGGARGGAGVKSTGGCAGGTKAVFFFLLLLLLLLLLFDVAPAGRFGDDDASRFGGMKLVTVRRDRFGRVW